VRAASTLVSTLSASVLHESSPAAYTGQVAEILVTGGSGFVGAQVILQLLENGSHVRTTVRTLDREREVRDMMTYGGATNAAQNRLSFYAADLTSDAGWAEAVAGCEYVIHVASPMSPKGAHTDQDLIVPAREGALRVLRAARDFRVKRVVMTSSCGAVYYGHPLRSSPFDETSWTIVTGDLTPYVKSKAIAERAAWDLMEREGQNLELSVINPAGIFGPILGPHISSVDLIKRLLDGMPACPRLFFGIVDVRDVADLHIRAMTHPAAKGERFIAVAGNAVSMFEIAKMLRARLGPKASRVPRFQMPDWAVRLAAKRDPALRQLLPLLGNIRNATSEKARRVLGWSPRPEEEVVIATAKSLLEFGAVKS
jgi:dihydroflavonol-4-reductase